MGKVVYAEDNLLNYLRAITNVNSSSVGLIIGQSTNEKVYVVHMARTMQWEKGNDVEVVEALTFNTVKDIEEHLISAHRICANGKLPGGLSVLGTFICSPTDIFSDASLQPTLKKLLPSSKKGKMNESFSFSSTGSEALLFHYNPIDHKYMCKLYEVGNLSSTATQVDWKFQKNCTKWCQISCQFGLNFPPVVEKKSVELKTVLENFLSNMNHTLGSAFVVVGDKVMNPDKSLESFINATGNKKIINDSEIQLLEASIFTPLPQESVNSLDVHVTEHKYKITIKGIIKSQAFISQKGTMEDAIAVVKQDISRSLATRIWLHLESLVEEPEERNGSLDVEETIHELPRRVTVSLPNTPLCFTDYIFSGEDDSEVVRLFKAILDVDVTEKDINQEYEIHADPSAIRYSTKNKIISAPSDDLLRSTLPTGFLIAAISFAVILIAIAIALHIQRNVSPDGKST